MSSQSVPDEGRSSPPSAYTVVNEIEWSDECVCAKINKTGIHRQYCAPYAIVTLSIGTLKAHSVSFINSRVSYIIIKGKML